MRNAMNSILATIFMVTLGNLALAQELNGNYTSSVGQITFDNAKMIVTKDVYEYYGLPYTVYSYSYKVIRIDDNHLKLKLRKSKIIDGPKRLKGSGRTWPKSRNPKIDGSYEIKIIEDGIQLINSESSEKIILKKKST